MITYKLLEKHTGIAHFCTSRHGGASVGNFASNNLSPFTGDNPVSLNENQTQLCNRIGVSLDKLIIPFQTHGIEVREIENNFFELSAQQKSEYLNGVDALITKLPGVCIGITTADCVPIIFFDPLQNVIAVAHAGWRGTCAKIAEKVVRILIHKYNCLPKNILVSIGPSISAEVYEVGNDLIGNFEDAGFDITKLFQFRDNTIYLDLWKANQLTLEQNGILTQNIEISGICTYTQHEQFFSARRLGIKSGRMLSGIMLI